MKRIVKIGIAVIAAMLILGFVSCDNGTKDEDKDKGGGGGGSSGEKNDATLSSVKFEDNVATLGTPGNTYLTAVPGSVTLLSSNATVEATPANSEADVQCLLLKSGGTYKEADLFYEWKFEFETSDKLVIRVISEDKTATKFYVIGITLADVALSTLTVGGADVTLPNPATTWQSAEAGSVLFQSTAAELQTTGGLAVAATAAKTGSVIKYGHAVGSAAPTFSDTSTITFVDGEFLYIEVSSAGNSKAYYKVKLNFMQSGKIRYGKVEIKGDSDKYIDPLWNDISLDTYTISKRVMSDTWNNKALETSGIARALWDEEGLYIYVIVTDPDVSSQPKTGSTAHETDSVELFVNEGLPNKVYSNGGSQYRVGANGERSGEGDSPTALEALNKTSAWKTDTGYIVIFQAPWRLRSKFISADTYKNGWKIGFELQINAAPVTGSRYGTLVWNNTAHTNYQNANDYGEAELINAPATLNFPALPPVISGNPSSSTRAPGGSVNLTVTASTKDSGTLSYQWYSAASTSAEGTAIGGATSSTYSFSAPASTTFYYAVVTNTLGTSSKTATSARARITVSTEPMIDKFALRANNAVYKFILPEDAKFEDYKAITIEVKMDAANYDKTIRSVRLMGNYKESDFSVNTSSGYMFFAFDAANAPYIYDDRGLSYINDATTGVGKKDEWFTIEYRLVGNSPNTNFVAANKPANDAAGPFLFGVGLPGTDTGGAKTQLIKNITMVHTSDSTKNVTTAEFFGFVGYGSADLENTSYEPVEDK